MKSKIYLTLTGFLLSITIALPSFADSAARYLSSFDVTMNEAKAFVRSNIATPETIYNVSREYGISSSMLSEIVQDDFPGVDESEVRNFFNNAGLDGAMLAGCIASPPESSNKSLSLVGYYEFSEFFTKKGNILLDGNNLILAGGQRGTPAGATYDGHPAFSNKVYAIDINEGPVSEFSLNAETGHPHESGTVANGIGNQAIIKKLSDGKYLIFGGFQYVRDAFILDLNESSLSTYPIDVTITDDTELNTTTFYTNRQAVSVFENGDFAFFGFNNGLYGMSDILLCDGSGRLNCQFSNASLTLARSNVDSYNLVDGRVLLVGGWDGTASVSENSATRRAEIYDPSSDTIVRILDYPEPKHDGKHRSSLVEVKNQDNVYVYNPRNAQFNYKYNLESGEWLKTQDCSIDKATSLIQSKYSDYLSGNDSGQFIGRTADGFLIFVDQSYTTSDFDDSCSCYPNTGGTRINVYREL